MRAAATARARAAITARASSAAAAAAAAADTAKSLAFLRDTLADSTNTIAVAGTEAEGWDSRDALRLMQRASLRRAAPLADTALHDYRGVAEGYVYFYGDHPAGSQKLLVRVNQVGLELYWKQPGLWRQRLVAMRHENPIPNGVRFHLDHLTLVQNGFGNVMRVGGGDEVRDVMHPAAPGAIAFYHFRIADSLELTMSGQKLRVYEVQVRPRDEKTAAIIGSVFVDRASAAIVRMNFTFTPASYFGDDIDYVNISLDNALYENRYWLANEEIVEIRRSFPLFDIGVGTVIRSRIHVREYQLNAPIPDSVFTAPPFARGRRMIGTSYSWERGVYADLDDAGLRQPPQLSELRADAEQIVRTEVLSGLPRVRPYAPGLSSLARYNRAEGLYLGAGVSYMPRDDSRYDVLAGYAFGSDHPAVIARAIRSGDSNEIILEGYLRRNNDLGPVHTGNGIGNSFTSAFTGNDYLDLFYASGARLSLRHSFNDVTSITSSAGIEQQTSAARVKSRAMFNRGASFRPVLPIDDGRDVSMDITLNREPDTGARRAWRASIGTAVGSFAGTGFVRPHADASVSVYSEDRSRSARVSLVAGLTTTDDAAQQLFVIGGRGTIPGYDYRAFAGRAGAVTNVVLSGPGYGDWASLRLLGSAGITSRPGGSAMDPSGWNVHDTNGIRTSAGAGLSLFWNTINVDAMRGLRGGHWEVDLSLGTALHGGS